MTEGNHKVSGLNLTDNEVVMLERVAHLRVVTTFEEDFIDELVKKFKRYGQKMQVSYKQLEVLYALNGKWEAVRRLDDHAL